jgi:hypothetical protein
MIARDHLRRLIESRSGLPAVVCDQAALRARLGFVGSEPIRPACGQSTLRASFAAQLERFLDHPAIGEYLCRCTPHKAYAASGVRILPLDAIRQHLQQLTPGLRIFWDGYLVIASSFSDNVICVHAPSGRVGWAYLDTIMGDAVSYQERNTGKWHCLPYTAENLERAVVTLSDSLEVFLDDLLNDKLHQQFAALD